MTCTKTTLDQVYSSAFCKLTYVGVFEVLEETDLTNGSAGSSLENAESVIIHLLAIKHHMSFLTSSCSSRISFKATRASVRRDFPLKTVA